MKRTHPIEGRAYRFKGNIAFKMEAWLWRGLPLELGVAVSGCNTEVSWRLP